MSTTARGGLFVGLLIGLATTASASTSFRVITVALYDYEGIPPATLLRAKTTAAEVFQTAGVRVVWVDPFASRPSIHVHVLSTAMSERAKANPDVLGLATVGSHMVYVLYPHVVHTARSFNLNLPRLLGYIIAHEIGHLLLPDHGHGVAGLMRATLDVRHIDYGLLYFTRPQRAAIRGAIDKMTP